MGRICPVLDRGRSMQRQGSFAEAEYAGKKKQTRRDKFLAEMEQAVPWSRLVARLAPLYPKGERGRPPIPLGACRKVFPRTICEPVALCRTIASVKLV